MLRAMTFTAGEEENIDLADKESEKKVLACILDSEVAAIEAFTWLDMDDFTDPFYRNVFGLAQSIFARGQKLSLGILLKECQDFGVIKNIKDFEILKAVLQDAETGYTAMYWIGRVKDASKARKIYGVFRNACLTVKNAKDKTPNDVIDEVVKALCSIDAKESEEFETGEKVAQVLEDVIDEKEQRFEQAILEHSIVLDGLTTGIPELDKYTLGYKPGDLIVLAAQTGHGKTAFAIHTIKTIAVERDHKVLYVNTEMSREIVYQRLCSSISRVPLYQIRQGDMRHGNKEKVNRAIQLIRRSGFIHTFSPNLTPSRCSLITRKAKIQKNVQMVIIDYIGRMEKYDPKQNEWQVLEQIAKSMKLLAQELEIPILVLAQLNEDGSLQGARRIKNECDLLLKLIPLTPEEKKTDKYTSYPDANYRLFIDKNRDGEGNKNIPIRFDPSIQLIEQAQSQYSSWEELGEPV